mgnify:CR=1 FL=1
MQPDSDVNVNHTLRHFRVDVLRGYVNRARCAKKL